MGKVFIIGAERTVNGRRTQGEDSGSLVAQIQQRGGVHELIIDPLATDWHSPLETDHFRSGCAPIEALERARELIDAGCPAVRISGRDALASGYARDERLQRMAIYGESQPIPDAYDALARAFIERQGISERAFRDYRDQLFDNYLASYRDRLASDEAIFPLPDARWYQPITPLFRGVDCANPLVDFEGSLLLCGEALLGELELPKGALVEIAGIGLGMLQRDGPAEVEQIARFEHLKQAHDLCCEQAGVAFTELFRGGQGLLELYTCYPVIPLAFLLLNGYVTAPDQLPELLSQRPVTVSGGMNLERAAWNNPALNGLILMVQKLRQDATGWGMVHGNGGLGYRQGVALLRCRGGGS